MVVLVVMGVCGCGKTTVAQKLAQELQVSFRDADEFHSEENKHKMNCGIPLTDEDRIPWLLDIHQYIQSLLETNSTGIVTCSALKYAYRSILVLGKALQDHGVFQKEKDEAVKIHNKNVLFVYLHGSANVIQKRLEQRKDHFMPPTLLSSQLESLEEPSHPENFISVNVDKPVEDIISYIMENISIT